MSDSPAPIVYFVYGTPASGRRAILGDLVLEGLEAGDRPLLLLAEGEPPSDVERAFRSHPGAHRAVWRWVDQRIAAELPPDVTHVFLLADPWLNPVDQAEALVPWLQERGARLARIFTVIDVPFAAAHPQIERWFEACIHFSDVVFLTGVTADLQNWAGAFEGKFRERHFPCLWERVRDNTVANPALMLAPEARRMSGAFDDIEPPPLVALFEDEDDEAEEEDPEDQPIPEPYFARRRGGSRVIEVPAIGPYLKI